MESAGAGGSRGDGGRREVASDTPFWERRTVKKEAMGVGKESGSI